MKNVKLVTKSKSNGYINSKLKIGTLTVVKQNVCFVGRLDEKSMMQCEAVAQ